MFGLWLWFARRFLMPFVYSSLHSVFFSLPVFLRLAKHKGSTESSFVKFLASCLSASILLVQNIKPRVMRSQKPWKLSLDFVQWPMDAISFSSHPYMDVVQYLNCTHGIWESWLTDAGVIILNTEIMSCGSQLKLLGPSCVDSYRATAFVPCHYYSAVPMRWMSCFEVIIY